MAVKVELMAPAKVNFTLDVTGVRPDGYHAVATVMQSISLADRVRVALVEGAGISLTSNWPALSLGPDNLAWRAAELLLPHLADGIGVAIHLEKQIPVGAGLGGGSADAAAVLKALNYLAQVGLTTGQLAQLGRRLGADVPFAVVGGTALGRGRGDELTLLPSPECLSLVLVRPHQELNTRLVYQEWRPGEEQSTTMRAVAALYQRWTGGLLNSLSNGLLRAAGRLCPVLPDLLEELRAAGALAVNMSGSGATVYGVVQDEATAAQVAAAVAGPGREVWLAQTLAGAAEPEPSGRKTRRAAE